MELGRGHVSIWRVPSPLLPGGAPLFYGTGAPEALEQVDAPSASVAFAGALSFAAAFRSRAASLARARAWTALEAHWLVPSGVVAALVAPDLPRVCWVHSGDVALLERLRGRGGRTLARWLSRQGGELRFVSEDLRRRFGTLAGQLVGETTALPLPREMFPPSSPTARASARAALGVSGRCILTVARLVPIKGIDLLIDACAEVPPPFDLVIVGDGPAREALELQARSRAVPARFVGQRPRDEVARWLTAADVYVQPSRRLPSGRTEGMPTAVREALAVGVPVVATRTGGLSALGETAILTPEADPAALARGIRRALAAANT
jgi:glycosyltransferase involved in cell wall biosynthesis